jgi:hypothetical protein
VELFALCNSEPMIATPTSALPLSATPLTDQVDLYSETSRPARFAKRAKRAKRAKAGSTAAATDTAADTAATATAAAGTAATATATEAAGTAATEATAAATDCDWDDWDNGGAAFGRDHDVALHTEPVQVYAANLRRHADGLCYGLFHRIVHISRRCVIVVATFHLLNVAAQLFFFFFFSITVSFRISVGRAHRKLQYGCHCSA